MKNVLIVGAGGLGREVFGYLRHLQRAQPRQWQVKGFLDDNAAALEGLGYKEGVVGAISSYKPEAGDLFVCGIGNPAIKARVCQSLKERGAEFMTLIHPSAVISCNVVFGEGVVVAPHAVVNADAQVGDFVFLNCFSACGHDSRIGDYTTLSSYCDITGSVRLGKRVFVGSHGSVIPGRRVGDDVNIGAGSVVVSHIAAGRRVFGVPAKNIINIL